MKVTAVLARYCPSLRRGELCNVGLIVQEEDRSIKACRIDGVNNRVGVFLSSIPTLEKDLAEVLLNFDSHLDFIQKAAKTEEVQHRFIDTAGSRAGRLSFGKRFVVHDYQGIQALFDELCK